MPDPAIALDELRGRLAAEFPEAFHPGSSLSIVAIAHGMAQLRYAFRPKSLRPGGTTTLEEAEVKFAYYKDWCRFPIDPVLHPVWEELVMLLPGRPWLASGAGLQAVPKGDGSDASAYEDDVHYGARST